MSTAPRQSRKALRNKPQIAGLLLALFVFVLAMAQFKALHQLLHADAAAPTHQCAVTLLGSGQVDAPAAQVAVVSVSAVVVGEQIAATNFVPSVDYSLLPSRGPPALLT